MSCSAGPELALPLRVPDYPWLPGLTIALYVAIIAIFVGTQPELALGGGAMVAALAATVVVTVRNTPKGAVDSS